LDNLVYPAVSSLAAAKQLKHVLPKNRPYVLHLILKEMGLKECGTNTVEGSLCKTSEVQVGKIFDHVFPGQMQMLSWARWKEPVEALWHQ
jgi:hypothetical protein